MKKKWFALLGCFVLMMALSIYLSAPKVSTKGAETDETEGLPVIGSKENLEKYFRSILKEENKFQWGFRNDMAVEETAESSNDMSGGTGGVSETNIQVEGVDEGDIVKTDGNHIYQVVDGKVNIIETNGGTELKRIKTISYSNTFTPYQLYLHEEKLVVLGHSFGEWDDNQKQASSMIAPVQSMTNAIVYDIANPSEPKEERTVSLEGHMISSRKIDHHVYIVANQSPPYWLLREQSELDLRPKYMDSAASEDLILVDYEDIQYFPDSKESNYTLVAAFDLKDPEKESKITTYLGSGHQLYMSKENLYLAVEDWLPFSMREENVKTTLYKFAVDDVNVEFHSKTEVDGRILNQFSMDEHNGYFRIATTTGMVWDETRPSANHLFIYDENLVQVSSIEDLARGERIYSARFMGDKIYIVTFRETDPLFVIDASNPKSPKLLGELKIPGFSNYLHPLDEHHLLGFGYDTKVVPTKGNQEPLILTEGIKLSLFDITDMENPKEKFTEVIGGRGTYSPLNYDHKALLVHRDKNLYAFPINIYENVEGSEFESKFLFQGALVYHIDVKNGFTLEEKITHLQGNEPYAEWEKEVQRIIYIGDTLYVLSNSSISSHSLTDFQLLEKISF